MGLDFRNPILMTDSYKLAHWMQYPPKTDGVYSYFEARTGAKYNHTLFFGLQYLLQEYLAGQVFDEYDMDDAERLITAHLGDAKLFNRAGWQHILDQHNGYLPLRIKAVPEGLVVPTNNVLMTVENTDPEVPWLTNYVETLLTHVWYPSTVATVSWHVKQDIKRYLKMTSSEGAIPDFMLHDFGYRGATGEEAAAIGGLAHLVNFKGTDTLAAMQLAVEHYGADYSDLAFSVPATEHSVMTAEGRDGELDVLDRLIDTYPTGILSVVADSYNIYDFVKAVCARSDVIKARDGVLVVRPDSTTDRHPTPQGLTEWIVNELAHSFGSTVVRGDEWQDFRTLDPHVRVLWGDGIGPEGIEAILHTLKVGGWSAENMVFGMGGGLLQKVNRDTQRFAFKSSAQKLAGEPWRDIRKEPLDASKTSKGGRLQLINNGGTLQTVRDQGLPDDLLQTVFENGEVVAPTTLAEVRERADI